MVWDESNFKPEDHGIYTKQAYDEKQWAFVSDVARLYALKEYGGVYVDTDMELIKPIDDFRDLPAFFSFEIETEISTGIIGAEPHHPFIEELYNDYDGRTFIQEDGSHDRKTNVIRITEIMTERGLKPDNTKQVVENCHIFPLEYFSPKDYWTREVDATDNTYGIHQFTGSWL
ncbi:glycosyltransferase family 32 protein [Marinilactibacillus psychrotolerans]|nr:glycosyltransferase [Marinilactibacillus psychrotolerans]